MDRTLMKEALSRCQYTCPVVLCFLHPGGQEDEALSLHLGRGEHPYSVSKPARTLAMDFPAYENFYSFPCFGILAHELCVCRRRQVELAALWSITHGAVHARMPVDASVPSDRQLTDHSEGPPEFYPLHRPVPSLECPFLLSLWRIPDNLQNHKSSIPFSGVSAAHFPISSRKGWLLPPLSPRTSKN